MKRERDNRRCEKAIDELIKIHDDGHGSETMSHILTLLRNLTCSDSDYVDY